jgi:precorrin-8X/cobalt-precorrin-8 methylmutase
MADRLGLGLYCFIDNLQIKEMAEQQRTTRAEIAMDHALAMEGLKLIAVGTAPMALSRLLARSATREMKDVVVIATPNAFTNAIQLKERIWESGIPCVVVRGKRGGNPVAGSLVNALMAQALRQKEL